MFESLQQKWKVGPFQIVLIIACFALGGSLTGYGAKKIMDVLSVEKDWQWTILYILLVTLIWPVAILIVSFFFGQFRFFKGYVTRLGRKIGVVRSSKFGVQSSESADGSQFAVQSSESPDGSQFTVQTSESVPRTHDSRLTTHDSQLPINLAIFASGAGSNAQKIIDHFRNSPLVKVEL